MSSNIANVTFLVFALVFVLFILLNQRIINIRLPDKVLLIKMSRLASQLDASLYAANNAWKYVANYLLFELFHVLWSI